MIGEASGATAEVFRKEYEVGWRDLDLNGHMANFIYLTYAVGTRMAYFSSQGFSADEFARHGFGPVIKTDLTEYFREFVMLERFSVTMENGGHSEDGSRFRVVNNFYKDDGTLAARVTSIGGWLSLKERKLILPPEELRTEWIALSRTEDFQILPTSIKR